MHTPIIPAKTAIKTFRDAGYKSTAAAVAEIIDNSIEANAKNIKILVSEDDVKTQTRIQKIITHLAIIDDGNGMDRPAMETSLQFGNGTKLKSRKGIGRFGIGLPNASISQCKKVEVYSWQNSKCLYAYLDLDEVEKNQQQNINPVIEKELPDFLKKEAIKSKNGTAVIWSECDRLDVSRAETLFNRMSKDLCRIFRHFLDNDDDYGKKVSIKYKIIGEENEKELLANDPLYLMTPNNCPGYENEAIMELKTNDKDPREGRLSIAFIDPLTLKPAISNVLFRFSAVKQSIRKNEADKSTEFMNHLKRNIGISFVRAGREVDFGNFGFYPMYSTTDRWWGCEIRFEPELDEIFGVTNDKQSVRGMGPLTKDTKDATEITDEDIENNPKYKLRQEITKRFNDFHKKYIAEGKEQMGGSRSKLGSRSVSIADRIFKRKDDVVLKSKLIAQKKTEKQIEEEYIEKAKKIEEITGEKFSTDELKKFIDAQKKLEVDIDLTQGWEATQFFSLQQIGKTAVVNVNNKHKFYDKLYQPIAEKLEQSSLEIVDLMLIAWARLEDELSVTDIKTNDFIKIRERWGQRLSELIEEQEKLD